MEGRYSPNGTLWIAAVEAELGDIPGVPIGIGPINAAIGTMCQLHRRRPKRVVLVGSCGAYGTKFRNGTAIVGEELVWRTAGEVAKLAYGLGELGVLRTDSALRARLRVPSARVVTTPAITVDPAVARDLGAQGGVEHLETYGAAAACARWGVPFVAVLGVANEVGPQAHAQWKAHRAEAEEAARAAVRHAFAEELAAG